MQITNKKPLVNKDKLFEVANLLDNQKNQVPIIHPGLYNKAPQVFIKPPGLSVQDTNIFQKIQEPIKVNVQPKIVKPVHRNIIGFREEFFKLSHQKKSDFIEIICREEFKNPHFIQNDLEYSHLLTELMFLIKTSKTPSVNNGKSICFMDQILDFPYLPGWDLFVLEDF